MKILHILPELQLGGVERHVIDLANEQVKRNFRVLVVSAGGQMESQLVHEVLRRHLPVHLKNPVTALYCACQIARWVKKEGWQIIHAHSRVPAWIAEWAAYLAGVPYVVTAHVDFGTKTHWIYAPYRNADKVICVSRAVQDAMKNCFYDNTTVIVNGIKRPGEFWDSAALNENRLLFVGRLSSVKGLQDVLNVLPVDGNWTLDVVGEGPQKEEWEKICLERGIAEKVFFRGYSDQVEHYMAHSSVLLFPSYTEGMPLTLAQAILTGIPVLASDIKPVIEMKGTSEGLIRCGSQNDWKKAIDIFLASHKVPGVFPKSSVPTLEHMVDQIADVYRECL